MTPEVPFVTDDGLVHRVSADAQRWWIEKYSVNNPIELLTQCGVTLAGVMRPIGSSMLTCLSCIVCIVCIVREAEWPALMGDRYAFLHSGRDTVFNTTLKVVRVDGVEPEDFVYFEDGTHSKQKHLLTVPRIYP